MENNLEQEIEIFRSLEEYEIGQVCAILSENAIPFVRKDFGSGSYMNLYMGQSLNEKTIFVSQEDYDRAIELISNIVSKDLKNEQDEILEQELESEYNDDNEESLEKHTRIRRIFGMVFFGFPVGVAIISLIIAVTGGF